MMKRLRTDKGILGTVIFDPPKSKPAKANKATKEKFKRENNSRRLVEQPANWYLMTGIQELESGLASTDNSKKNQEEPTTISLPFPAFLFATSDNNVNREDTTRSVCIPRELWECHSPTHEQLRTGSLKFTPIGFEQNPLSRLREVFQLRLCKIICLTIV
jgi:hypothetical protein